MSITLLLDNATRKYADRIALEDDTRSFSYKDFINRVDKFGQALLSCGIVPGETIACLTKNSIDLVEFDAAAARFGFCLLYTSPSPRDRQKSRMPSSA